MPCDANQPAPSNPRASSSAAMIVRGLFWDMLRLSDRIDARV
jgi:hypothetical protein